MQLTVGPAFDQLAKRYDALWTNSDIGRKQREAVWRRVDPLFRPGDSILDLGCGTGADAVHFMSRGLNVLGVDASAEMVALATARGVEARRLALENIDDLEGHYDGAISNFGALNCVGDLQDLSAKLGSLIRRGGFLAICMMGPICLWEVCHYLNRAAPGRAFRRFSSGGSAASIGIHVNYSSVRQIRFAFKHHFELLSWMGIGLCVPPSYIAGLSAGTIEQLGAIDRCIAHWPVFRMFSDHRLLVFIRL
jgi:cyclopropane fatty-acyl-phospholipid synthase-like methyltransferase